MHCIKIIHHHFSLIRFLDLSFINDTNPRAESFTVQYSNMTVYIDSTENNNRK